MNTKLVIGGVLIALALIIFYITQPEQVAAPTGTPSADEGGVKPVAEAGTLDTSVDSAVVPAPAKSYTPPISTPSLPYSATVFYDGDRFIPDTVTIIEGGTVRFMNTGTEKMWIGADNHPTHDRYPIKNDTDCLGSSFDQCTAVGNGISWSYTFARTGTWGYHNHTRARDTGSVIVMTKEEYLKAQ